ncbi:MAG: DUF3307 domain-containing protein [Candidatus Portnoybacteria bacterium]|nr:DUF3307 domain-containing protein [Candidatus Portnoybacteria bacterium]
MAAELFIWALFGHFAGDYWFQTKKMALNKMEPGWRGIGICYLHSTIYAVAVYFSLWAVCDLFIFLVVLHSHWIIDRVLLASLWLKLIRGRTFESAFNSRDVLREFDISFTSLVYAVVDSSFHLLVLWLLINYWII